MAWLKSDDMSLPGALSMVGEIFATFPEIEWLTTLHPLWIDVSDRLMHFSSAGGYSRKGFFRGEHLGEAGRHHKDFVQQESTFWRRSRWERPGGALTTRWRLAGDFELWARFHRHAELYDV